MDSLIIEKELFGGKIQIIVYNPLKNAKRIVNKMYNEGLRLQKIFNFFDKESELSRLNEKKQMQVSPEMIEVVKKSLEFAELTEGKYNPLLGKQIMQRKSKEKEKPLKISYKDLEINRNEIILKNPEAMLDLGSIAKGYITDKLAEFLKSKGITEFIINSRGDIIFSGETEHVIGIQNPREMEKAIMNVKVKNKCIATSGDYKQFYGSYKKSHILNGNDAISITTIADTLEDADVIATALFVSNEKQRDKILKKFKNIKALIIKENLAKKKYNNFDDIIKNETAN